MSRDASYEDGHERPLNLGALDAEDLKVISSLVQDAVFAMTDMQWRAGDRRLAFLLNRFRWEDEGRDRHGPERVRSVLVIDNVLGVASSGIDRQDRDTVLSVLALEFEPGKDGAGHMTVTLAGDGAIRAEVEAVDVGLRDVTRPYRAPSGKTPDHGA